MRRAEPAFRPRQPRATKLSRSNSVAAIQSPASGGSPSAGPGNRAPRNAVVPLPGVLRCRPDPVPASSGAARQVQQGKVPRRRADRNRQRSATMLSACFPCRPQLPGPGAPAARTGCGRLAAIYNCSGERSRRGIFARIRSPVRHRHGSHRHGRNDGRECRPPAARGDCGGGGNDAIPVARHPRRRSRGQVPRTGRPDTRHRPDLRCRPDMR